MPTRTQLAAEIFDEAADLPTERRRAYLDEACKNDPALRGQVESLLSAEETAGAFLSNPQFNPAEAAEQIGGDMPGGRIGHYKLVELIGEGGFGRVFLAEQDRPVKRRVALKVIKLGMDTRQVIARFSVERQALALMDHPNIARVLDAGTTDAGRPYFVMELVRGTPITCYCQVNRLSVAERLQLFAAVCQAVQHAHQKGIIHRDLKPSNILITLLDGKPVPKIIDFGIAKATQQRLTEQSIHTGFHALLGTPAYMSPEQATLSGEDIDTRSDLYSLGVMLYELLTGTTPFDPLSLQNATYADVQRMIQEVDPPKPSTRVWSMRDTIGGAGGHAGSLGGPPSQLRSVLRGELDWIVMKCLEKQRSRRYESASALAKDIEAYLSGKPVAAAPPSSVYRSRKFVQQHAIAMGAGAAIVTAMAVGLVIAVLALQRLRVEQQRTLAEKQQAELSRQRALAANDTASAVNDFVNDMLASADPNLRGKAITVEQLLHEADETLGERFEGRPLVEAGVRETIGRAYIGMGETKLALNHLQTAMDLRKAQGIDKSPEFLVSRAELAIARHMTGLFEPSKDLFREVIADARKQLESNDRDIVRAVDVLARSATYIAVPPQDLQELFAKATTRRQQLLGEDHPDTLSCRASWGWYVGLLERYAESEQILRETTHRMRRVLGPADAVTLRAINRHTAVLSIMDRRSEALEILREAAAESEKVHGFEHPLTLTAYNHYAEMLKKDRQYGAALQIEERRLAGVQAVFGNESSAMLGSLHALGNLYEELNQTDRAMAIFRRRNELTKRVFGPDSINAAFSEFLLADKHERRREFTEAIGLIEHSLPILRKSLSPDSARLAEIISLYARALFESKRIEEAVPLADEAMAIAGSAWQRASPATRMTLSKHSGLCAMILSRARGPVAAEAAVRSALERLAETSKPNSAMVRELNDHLRKACEQTGRAEEAAKLAVRIAEIDSALAARAATRPGAPPATAPTEPADGTAAAAGGAGLPPESISD